MLGQIGAHATIRGPGESQSCRARLDLESRCDSPASTFHERTGSEPFTVNGYELSNSSTDSQNLYLIAVQFQGKRWGFRTPAAKIPSADWRRFPDTGGCITALNCWRSLSESEDGRRGEGGGNFRGTVAISGDGESGWGSCDVAAAAK